MFCIIILHLLYQLSSMERGNFKGLEYPEHLISYRVLTDRNKLPGEEKKGVNPRAAGKVWRSLTALIGHGV